MRRCALFLLSLALVISGCGGGDPPIVITISLFPTLTTVVLGGTQQFTANVSGATDTSVTWFVNDVEGGNATVGTINENGLYTAPVTPPNPVTVTIKVVSDEDSTKSATGVVTIDSGIRITLSPVAAFIGVTETMQFTATVSGAANPAVTWFVNDIENGNSTVGTISDTGLYTAPTTVPSPANVSVKATSDADTSRFGNAPVGIIIPSEPTIASVSPPTTAQGSFFQDVYLTGNNFITTTVFHLNGIPITPTRLTGALVRIRVPQTSLADAGLLTFTASRQTGPPSAPVNLGVIPVRPALLGSTPNSAIQNGSNVSVDMNGGFFSPSVFAEFDGQIRSAIINNSRQLEAVVQSTDLSTAGLFSLAVRNPGATPSLAAVNLAIQPSVLPTLLTTLAVGDAPSAVAVNNTTGIAVVTNSASNTVTRIDLKPALPVIIGAPIAVGTLPTGVAIDDVRNVALVVNRTSRTLSVIDLVTGAVIATVDVPPLPANPDDSNSTPTPSDPFSVGVNPLTGLALVANAAKNFHSVFSLATNTFVGFVGGTPTESVSTGAAPVVSVEPLLNWAVITPGGGTGAINIVDLALRKRLITATIGGVSARGLGLNTETKKAVLTNPNTPTLSVFSYLDQVVTSVSLETGHVAAAVNPLTDIAITVNELTNLASVIDLRTPARLSTIAVGTAPTAVAVDPGSNRAIVVNRDSDNVSILSLGPIRPLHVTAMNPPFVFSSSSSVLVNITGSGFLPGATVRLDQNPVATVFVNDRALVATIPAGLVSTARRFALDVLNPGAGLVRSNVSDFAVIGAIPVGIGPRAVAIDPIRDIAVVTNAGAGTVSIVNLITGDVSPPLNVGSNPQGVAVIPRLGLAVVTNRGSNTANVINLDTGVVGAAIPVGTEPIGVAIHPDTGAVVVANSGSHNVSLFNVLDPSTTFLSTDQRPVAVAIDPVRNLAGVVCSTTGSVLFINMTGPVTSGRITITLTLPTDITFDPVTDRFLAVASLNNQFASIDPVTLQFTLTRVGVNPTSLAYNFQTGTLATVNTASRTLTVFDFLDSRVRAILPITGSDNASIQIHPRTNFAVVPDQANNRLLIVPLPR